MKRLFLSALLLLLCCFHVNAEEMNLKIRLPALEMTLIPARPPGMQEEALPLLEETLDVKEYLEYLNRGEFKEALAHIRKSDSFAIDLIESGDPEGELKHHAAKGGLIMMNSTGSPFEPGARINHISAYLLYLIGYNYLSLDKYKEAEIAFLAALAPLPDFISVHTSLGQLYMMLERYEDARKHLVHAAGRGFHTAGLFGALGYINYQTKNFLGAEKAFQKAVMFKPDFKLSRQWEMGLLYSLIRTHKYQSALTLAEGLLKEYPDDAHLWLVRASAASYSGEREVSLSSLETAIRLGDRRASNLQFCAALHMELGGTERAVDLMKSGFAEGMDFRYLDQGMGWLEQAEEWVLLGEMIDSAHDKWDTLDKPQQSRVLTREADISVYKGDKAAAGDTLEKAIALDPSNAYALMNLAGIYLENDNYKRAGQLYQQASTNDLYRENALISLAKLAMDQEDYSRALQILRDMLTEFPGRTDLNRNIESLENIVLMQKDK
jgi:tetratricopeptide (TPR) repeat protein